MSKTPKIPVSLAEAVEFGPEQIEKNPESYSTRIFRSLASSPLFPFGKNKEPSAKDKLIVASVVVAALDTRIAELERDAAPYNRTRAILNAPLFKPIEPASDGGKSDDPTDPTEINWFQRYLTLRNVAGVLGVVISVIGGFVAFWTADYRARALDAEQKVAQTQLDVEFWKKQHDNYKSKADDLTKDVSIRDEQIKISAAQIGAKDAEIAGAKKSLEQVNSALANAQATISVRDKTIQALQDAAKQRTTATQGSVSGVNTGPGGSNGNTGTASPATK